MNRRHALNLCAYIAFMAVSLVSSAAAFAAPATHYTFTTPANGSLGAAFSFTVSANDATETVDTTYTGTVHFSVSSGYNTTLPADSTLTNGVGTFVATANTSGSITLVATDTVASGITGTSSPVVVPNPHNIALDTTSGASLLFPYFEVDSTSATGRNTLLSLQNNSATAILEHVTVWTDLGVPVFTFNIYLTGFDIASVDLYDAFVKGNLPVTASAGQEPNFNDQISPKGQFSQDINFASCNGQFPYPQPTLFPSTILGLKNALTGKASSLSSNKCSGFNHGDAILRGYITADTVNNCTEKMPTDAGYFINGGGDATNQNVTSGEYFLYSAGQHLMQSDSAVALHADATLYAANDYTFYGRFAFPALWNATDNRLPLPNTWAVDAQAAGMELIVWRDVKIPPTPFTCGPAVPPSMGLPLGQERAFSFDNQEQPLAIPAGTPFGLATQRVALGGAGFPLPVKPGWVYLGLGYQNPAVPDPNNPNDPKADQAYVTVLQYPESHATSTGTGAIALDSGQAAQHVHPLP